jgi:hypothetical protein
MLRIGMMELNIGITIPMIKAYTTAEPVGVGLRFMPKSPEKRAA